MFTLVNILLDTNEEEQEEKATKDNGRKEVKVLDKETGRIRRKVAFSKEIEVSDGEDDSDDAAKDNYDDNVAEEFRFFEKKQLEKEDSAVGEKLHFIDDSDDDDGEVENDSGGKVKASGGEDDSDDDVEMEDNENDVEGIPHSSFCLSLGAN